MFKPVRFHRPIVLAAIWLAMSGCPAALAQQPVDPYGNCCVASVVMTSYNAWTVTCGSCAANPGQYVLHQPDPDKLVFVGPDGTKGGSPYDAAMAICRCPSQDARRAREKQMRTFEGN